MNYQEYLEQREYLRNMFTIGMLTTFQWVECQAQLRKAYARAAAQRQRDAFSPQHMARVATI